MKHSVKQLGVNPLDQLICRNIFSGLFALAVGYCSKQQFSVNREMRGTLFARSLTGVTGNTALTYGIAIVPLLY